MRIAIIGTGHIGSTLAHHFADAGHGVAGANSRGPETPRELESELGEHAHAVDAGSPAEGGRHHQPGTPRYTVDPNAPQLRERLVAADPR